MMENNNEIIALFMGAKYWPKGNIMAKYSDAWEFPGADNAWNTKGLKYDTSWDWLMPVVEKIDQTCGGCWIIRPGYVCFESYHGELRKDRQFKFDTTEDNDESDGFLFLTYSIVIRSIKHFNSKK